MQVVLEEATADVIVETRGSTPFDAKLKEIMASPELHEKQWIIGTFDPEEEPNECQKKRQQLVGKYGNTAAVAGWTFKKGRKKVVMSRYDDAEDGVGGMLVDEEVQLDALLATYSPRLIDAEATDAWEEKREQRNEEQRARTAAKGKKDEGAAASEPAPIKGRGKSKVEASDAPTAA